MNRMGSVLLCPIVLVCFCDVSWIDVKLGSPHPTPKCQVMTMAWTASLKYTLPSSPGFSCPDSCLVIRCIELCVICSDQISTFLFRYYRYVIVPCNSRLRTHVRRHGVTTLEDAPCLREKVRRPVLIEEAQLAGPVCVSRGVPRDTRAQTSCGE